MQADDVYNNRLIIDIVVTVGFLIELLINLFAHSDHGFAPFYTSLNNWFDTAIVIGMLRVNV